MFVCLRMASCCLFGLGQWGCACLLVGNGCLLPILPFTSGIVFLHYSTYPCCLALPVLAP